MSDSPTCSIVTPNQGAVPWPLPTVNSKALVQAMSPGLIFGDRSWRLGPLIVTVTQPFWRSDEKYNVRPSGEIMENLSLYPALTLWTKFSTKRGRDVLQKS